MNPREASGDIMAEGWGGKRPGSGRKPGRSRITKLIEAKSMDDCAEDVRYAIGLLITFMRDEDNDKRTRIDCAKELMDRVLGKATQHTELSGTNELQVTLIGGINAVDEEPPAE